jgi:hypothetical protein
VSSGTHKQQQLAEEKKRKEKKRKEGEAELEDQ